MFCGCYAGRTKPTKSYQKCVIVIACVHVCVCVCVCVCVQCVPIAREESDSSDFVDSAEGRLNCSPDNPFL